MCVITKKTVPTTPSIDNIIMPSPATMPRLARVRIATRGAAVAAKERTSNPSAIRASVAVDPQPLDPASMSPQTRSAIPPAATPFGTNQSRVALRGRSGVRTNVLTKPRQTTVSAADIHSTDCHAQDRNSTPPMMGPAAEPARAPLNHDPKATVSSEPLR